ncbi:hypothetical protein [Veronia pacifica]|uniref:Uncharacterized protein n=1 Tax=Veronia pacifica TaxID=1080227 RepID=A0A1C3EG90_9GAMM|nr:hypothetical protein [Veronia pacifica]ODA32245.1 hypothetical protein A8L45_13715 [Veronia pacifica]
MKTYITGVPFIKALDELVVKAMSKIEEEPNQLIYQVSLFCLDKEQPYRLIQLGLPASYQELSKQLVDIGFEGLTFDADNQTGFIKAEFYFDSCLEWHLYDLQSEGITSTFKCRKAANS